MTIKAANKPPENDKSVVDTDSVVIGTESKIVAGALALGDSFNLDSGIESLGNNFQAGTPAEVEDVAYVPINQTANFFEGAAPSFWFTTEDDRLIQAVKLDVVEDVDVVGEVEVPDEMARKFTRSMVEFQTGLIDLVVTEVAPIVLNISAALDKAQLQLRQMSGASDLDLGLEKLYGDMLHRAIEYKLAAHVVGVMQLPETHIERILQHLAPHRQDDNDLAAVQRIMAKLVDEMVGVTKATTANTKELKKLTGK